METLTMKNKQTGKMETIQQNNMTNSGWGFSFTVDSEIEAYKAAYQYKDSKHGIKVEYAKGICAWMVTVFNEQAKAIGIDGSK